ncbi:PilW family protein [Porticoccaceae bacterium nBUS_09]
MIKRQFGFTLIELMISLALGIAISWVVLDVSLNAMRNSRDIIATGDVIEKGRYLAALLKREIRHAGFYGRITSANIVLDPDNPQTDWCTVSPTRSHLTTPVFGLNNQANLCNGIDLLDNSDVLMIRRASTTVASSLAAAQHYIQSDFNGVILATGTADNFTLTEMDGTTAAPIREFYQDIYYVDSNKNFKRRRLVNGAIVVDPLVEGVDDFQLQYDIDTDADNIADTFSETPAFNNYSHWQNVKAVSVSLLISGEMVSQPDTKTYNYAGKSNVTFNDKRKRRLFSFVVAVGNQHYETVPTSTCSGTIGDMNKSGSYALTGDTVLTDVNLKVAGDLNLNGYTLTVACGSVTVSGNFNGGGTLIHCGALTVTGATQNNPTIIQQCN